MRKEKRSEVRWSRGGMVADQSSWSSTNSVTMMQRAPCTHRLLHKTHSSCRRLPLREIPYAHWTGFCVRSCKAHNILPRRRRSPHFPLPSRVDRHVVVGYDLAFVGVGECEGESISAETTEAEGRGQRAERERERVEKSRRCWKSLRSIRHPSINDGLTD